MDDEKFLSLTSMLIELESNLYNQTNAVYKLLTDFKYSSNNLYELKLSEIYSRYVILDTFLLTNENMQHYEFSSLLQYWLDAYHEMQDVVKDGPSRNTSWLYARYNTFESQHEIVGQMIKRHYDELKKFLIEKKS